MDAGTEHFTRVVESFGELPEPVGQALWQVQPPESIWQMVSLPSQRYLVRQRSWQRHLPFGWRWTPPRFLAFGNDQITAVERGGEGTWRAVPIPLAALVEIRLVTVLLNDYLELAWVGADRIEQIRLEFSAVGARHIERALKQVRAAVRQPAAVDAPAPRSSVSLQHFPLKFYNFTALDLLPEDVIVEAVYEPAIRQPGKHWRSYLSPNRAITLTQHELVLVEDERPQWFGETYRMEQRFLPRPHVWRVDFEAQPAVVWMRVAVGGPSASREISVPLLLPQAQTLYAAYQDWLAGDVSWKEGEPQAGEPVGMAAGLRA